ncbi:MAG: hypothetical protein V3T30_07755 [Thermodesulfobacteriota bacterium]
MIKKLKKLNLILLTVFATFALASCGGGGGGGGSSEGAGGGGGVSVSSDTKTLQTSTIIQYAADDTWSYNVAITNTDGKKTENHSGTMVKLVMPSAVLSPVSGSGCSDLSKVYTFGDGSGTTSHVYFLQNPDGTIVICGVESSGTATWVATPAAGYYSDYVSPMSVGQTFNQTVTFTNGKTGSYPYTVEAVDTVTVPFGKFEAYRITKSMSYDLTDNSRLVLTETDYFVPGLGSIKTVKSGTFYYDDPEQGPTIVGSFTETLTLTGTTVVY